LITQGQGDLLDADVEALVNTVNCVGVMGKGIALQFKRRFPANFKSYASACARKEVQLGRMYVTTLDTMSGPRYIINFPTKNHWRGRSHLEYIEAGLRDLIQVVRDHEIKSIAIPPLGAGNGGLAWPDVEPLIRTAFDSVEDIDVRIYAPSNQHRELVGHPLRMTWGRAVLIQLIVAYVERRHAIEPWEDLNGASALEIQKLMYFASIKEPKLGLRFVQGSYGPYSEQVRHLLQGMEGTFLSGYGDGSDRVLDLAPIVPTDEAQRQASGIRQSHEIQKAVVDPTLALLDGFEGPYGVELMASVHWVATTEGAVTAEAASEAVRSWTARKAQLFGPKPVAEALGRLSEVGLLPEFAE